MSYLQNHNLKLESENVLLRRQIGELHRQVQFHQSQHHQNTITTTTTPSGVTKEVNFEHRKANKLIYYYNIIKSENIVKKESKQYL